MRSTIEWFVSSGERVTKKAGVPKSTVSAKISDSALLRCSGEPTMGAPATRSVGARRAHSFLASGDDAFLDASCARRRKSGSRTTARNSRTCACCTLTALDATTDVIMRCLRFAVTRMKV